MANIKVIGNQEHVECFLKRLVPLPQDDWVYPIWMVARKKYNIGNVGITRSEEMITRTFLHHNKYEEMIRRIRRFEVPEECYIDRNTGDIIPFTNYATYIDLTPKSMARALVGFSADVMNEIWEVTNDADRVRRLRNIDKLLFSKVHKTNATRKPYKIVDVDDKSLYEKVRKLVQYYDIPIEWITETHGGYHILIPSGRHLETFYKTFVPLAQNEFGDKVEILNDPMTPICGTYQGGFLTRPVDVDFWRGAKENKEN